MKEWRTFFMVKCSKRSLCSDGLDEIIYIHIVALENLTLCDANYNYIITLICFWTFICKKDYMLNILKRDSLVGEYGKIGYLTENKIADITKEVGIDIHDKEPFWKNSLKTIEEDIEKFIMLSKKNINLRGRLYGY